MFLFRLTDFPVLFPVCQFPQAAVGFQPGRMDFSLFRRRTHSTVRLISMSTVRKPARAEIRFKFRKAILQFRRADGFHLLDIKGAIARCIGDISAVFQLEELHMARRVPSAAELPADLTGKQ